MNLLTVVWDFDPTFINLFGFEIRWYSLTWVAALRFGGWLFWGIFCMFAMALEFLKYVIAGARQGAAEGASSYSISDYGSYFTVHNNSLRDGIIGFLTSAFLYIAIGPIALAFKMLGNLRTVIQCIVALRRLNAGNE